MHDLRLVVGFAFHTIVAVLLFALIGSAAAFLDFYTKVLSGFGVAPIIIEAIKATEYFLFFVDLVCFLVYVSRETLLLLRAMIAAPVVDASSDVIDSPK